MGLIKTACLATLGIEATVREALSELVRKGEASESPLARSVRGLLEKGETVKQDLQREEGRLVGRLCEKLNIPTRADLERLHRKLDDLAVTMATSRPERHS